MEKISFLVGALKVYLIVVCLLLLSIVSFGAEWKSIGPEGGNIGKIILSKSDPNTIITLKRSIYYGLGCSIWRSIDGGENYSNITRGLKSFFDEKDFYINDIFMDPYHPSIIYVATNNGLYVTNDGGMTYKQLGLQGENVTSIAISEVDNQIILAGTSGNGIFKSTDQGEKWFQVENEFALCQVNYLTFDPLNPLVIYACVSAVGILKSTDEGETWFLFGIDCDPTFVEVDPNNSDYIYFLGGDYGMLLYMTPDGGATWKSFDIGYPFVDSFTVDPFDSKKLYAGTPIGVCISDDGGETWECNKEQFLGNQDISAIAINPHNPSVVYAGTAGSGVYKSIDGGKNWEWASKGMNASFIIKMAIDSSETNTLYAGTLNGGFLRSDDNGDSWQIKNPIQRDSPDWNVFDIALSATNPPTVYIGTGCCLGLFKSNDKGENWVKLNSGSVVYALAVDPNNPQILYSNMGKSIDGGKTWTNIREMNDAYRIVLDPKDASVIYIVVKDILKCTEDGNNVINITSSISEEYKNNPRPSFAIDPDNSNILYAGFKGIFKSINGGASWSLIGLEGKDISALKIDELDSNVIYAGTLYDGFFRSKNNGETWENISDGLDSLSIFDIEESIDGKGRNLYAGSALSIYYFSESLISIASILKLSDPFRLKVTGSNFHSDLKVYIGGDENPWTNVKFKSSSQIVLKGGNALKAKFPKGVPVEIKIVNGDGGEATFTYKR